MPQAKSTLKDIAQALGVSTTTVHRALHGKPGVGDDTGAEIRRIAAQMGYKANYMASALKRRGAKLAVAFPEPSMDNRYYYLSLWQGIRRFFNEAEEFNIQLMEFYYPLLPGSNGVMLKEIFESTDELCGLITVAVQDNQSLYYLEKLANKGVSIILVGANLFSNSLCCIKAYDELAGSLAAELICAFYPGAFAGKIIITGNPVGSVAMVDQSHNIAGFEQHIMQHAPAATLLTAYSADANASANQVAALLEQHPDTYAIYASSARHTVSACRLLESHKLQQKVKLIGNDCFEESLFFLSRRTLTAVIDKKIDEQGYKAAQLLFNYVVKGNYPPGNTVYVEPSVVLSGSAAFKARV